MYYQKSMTSNITQEYSSSTSQIIEGIVATDFSGVIYGKVVVIPNNLALGNVSTDLTRTLELWNATKETQILTSTDETGFDGMILNGEKTDVMSPNSSNVYTLDVSSQGGSTINALILFNLDGESYIPTVTITGSRVVLWGYFPDFVNNSVTSYQYNTSIQTFYDGTEERFQNIIEPKMSFANRYLEKSKNTRTMQNVMNAVGSKTFLVPDFTRTLLMTEIIPSGSSVLKINNIIDLELGQFLFIGSIETSYLLTEIIAIDELTNEVTIKDITTKEYKTNEKIFPVYNCRTGAEQNITQITDEIISTDVTFNVIDNIINPLKDNPDVVFTMFDGKILLDVRPDFQELTDTYQFRIEDLNNGFGVNERISQRDEADILFDYAFICRTNDEIDYFKQLMFLHKGQLKDFWIPSYFNNLKLKQNITSTQTTLLIENNDNYSLNNNKENRKALLIELTDGRKITKSIINFLPEDNENEKVVIDSNFGENINLNQVRRIEFLYNVRLSSDTLTINYITDKTALIDLSFKTIIGE